MSISVEHPLGAEVALVRLAGEHDISTSHVLRRALSDLAGTAPLVVLDLRECLFVDSTILGVFAAAAKKLSGTGARLVAVNAGGIVAKAVRITGLDALLFPQADLDSAFMEALEQLTCTAVPTMP
ncbi:MAG: hypothetical protein JWO12_3398 [Frankiales bacterium]|nr:hypothetical protein [Frankiales bacterium]